MTIMSSAALFKTIWQNIQCIALEPVTSSFIIKETSTSVTKTVSVVQGSNIEILNEKKKKIDVP